jgi:hypothetical protein
MIVMLVLSLNTILPAVDGCPYSLQGGEKFELSDRNYGVLELWLEECTK